MPDVELLLWRAITGADFFNIERSRAAAPASGGGQSYISISFRGLQYTDLGEFLDVVPPTLIGTVRPTVELPDVAVAVDPTVSAPLEFAPRYQPPQPDDRYRIARQNRQYQNRHPAWTARYGFPAAPNNIAYSNDPLTPDLTYLKVYVARLDDGSYVAGFFNDDEVPAELRYVQGAERLFQPYDESFSAGLLRFVPGDLSLDELVAATRAGATPAADPDAAPEVADADEQAREAAGRRPTGQGRRQNADERRAIELRAVDVATDDLRARGWRVVDVSLTSPYDLHCTQGARALRVEVKGTTGDGSAVLLTPGEVRHARQHHPHVSLMVVSDIQLNTDPVSGQVTATGGVLDVVEPWEIDAHGELRATAYEYRRKL